MLNKPGQSAVGDDNYFLVPALGRVIAIALLFSSCISFQL